MQKNEKETTKYGKTIPVACTGVEVNFEVVERGKFRPSQLFILRELTTTPEF